MKAAQNKVYNATSGGIFYIRNNYIDYNMRPGKHYTITGNKIYEYGFLGVFVLLKFILQYILINPVYDLHRDEYLHLDQGKHVSWGYISVPPFTSWISQIIIWLGNSVYWVKFFPALFGAMTIVVVWFTIQELKGKLFAQLLGATALTFSVILRINILYQPNSLDILFWTLFYFGVIKYINSENKKWIWLVSIIFAFGFLNKYNIVFLLLGLLPALLLSRYRIIFLKRQLFFSMLLAFLIIVPNLWWQFQNDFPFYHHLKTLADTQLVNVNRGAFLKTQLIFFYNSIFILVAGFMAFYVYKPFSKYRLFSWAFIFTISLFLYFKA